MHPPEARGRWLRIVGRSCFIAAAAVAGYLVWIIWGTGLVTAQAQSDLRAQFSAELAAPGADPDSEDARVHLAGDAYAELVIPRIDLDMIVVEGTDTASLMRGPGHYPASSDPWDDTGRVAIAGHRTTYLHPFWNLDKVARGDLIRLITEYGTFDYRVTETRLVAPTDVSVADPTRQPTLILTTCNPRYFATQRLVVFADRTT